MTDRHQAGGDLVERRHAGHVDPVDIYVQGGSPQHGEDHLPWEDAGCRENTGLLHMVSRGQRAR